MDKMKIKGTGIYAPGHPITNDEVQKLTGVSFDSGKIESKIGIKTRYIAHLSNINETTADFAFYAAEKAIRDAELDPEDIDCFIVTTDTPEYISPPTSIIVQGRMQKGQRSVLSFDMNSSCAGFVSAFDVAGRMIVQNTSLKNICVIGVYNMPAYVRKGDAFGYSLFADGAGAFILGKNDNPENDTAQYIDGSFITDGTQWNYIGVYAGGTRKPVTKKILEEGTYGLELLHRLPGDRNVKLWPPLIDILVGKNNLKIPDIDHFFFTQINKSVIEEVMGILEMPMNRTTCIMGQYGYTGSACIPMAVDHAIKQGKIKRGDKIITVASGAGLAVGANLFIY